MQLQIEAQRIMEKRFEDKKIPDAEGKKKDETAAGAGNSGSNHFIIAKKIKYYAYKILYFPIVYLFLGFSTLIMFGRM